jgi:hypothetical protein
LNGRVLVGVSIVLALLVVAVGARAIVKRRRDEIRSIHHYHDRLDTLHVEQHDRGGSVRVVHDPPPPAVHADPERPRLDPTAAHLAPWDPSAPSEEPHGRHDRTWALDRMQSHARIDTGTVVIVAIVVGTLVAIAIAGYLIQRDRSTPTTTPAHAQVVALMGAHVAAGAALRVELGGLAFVAAPHGGATERLDAVALS